MGGLLRMVGAMTTVAQCIAQLVPLVQAGGENTLVLAESHVDQLVAGAAGDRDKAVALLGDLQDKLFRQTKPSPLRADVLDAIGARVVTLLEDGREGDLDG